MNYSAKCNIYEYSLATTWERFADRLSGSYGALFCVVSERPLPPQAQQALASSAKALGYGTEPCTFVTLCRAGQDEGAAAQGAGMAAQGAGMDARPQTAGTAELHGEAAAADATELHGEAADTAGQPQERGAIGQPEASDAAGQSEAPDMAERSKAAGVTGQPEAPDAGMAGRLEAPGTGVDSRALDADSLFRLIEGLDPNVIVAADAAAARTLGAAYRAEVPPSGIARLLGRSTVAFRSFPDMLGSQDGKQKAWALLKRLPAFGTLG